MGKRNIKISTVALLISCVLFIFLAGCSSKGGIPKNISESEIYPTEDMTSAKIFDASHNEKAVSLSNEDIEFILKTLKNAKKEIATEYDSGLVELNITFEDSVIQLVRKDDETIYYVFHNNKICAICYKINSKELSEFISKAG